LLPDPVAAVWGAQHHNLLPVDKDPKHSKTFLVLDVGGYVTQLSIVQKDIVLNHFTLQWGGETPIELLVSQTLAPWQRCKHRPVLPWEN
jgi:hypothetical protein